MITNLNLINMMNLFRFCRALGVFLLILLPLGVYAEENADQSNIFKVSSMRLITKSDVGIFSERVQINVEGDYCRVKVSYEFWNNTESSFDLQAGIPFYIISNTLGEDRFEWDSDYVKDFKATFEDGQLLTVTDRMDDPVWNDSLVSSGSKTSVRTKRRMYLISFKMPQLTSKTVNIEYKVKSYFKDTKNAKTFIPKYSARLLQYDFTPAISWGKGTIRDFSLTINGGDIPKDFIHASGVGFTNLKWMDGYYMMNQTDMPINKYSILHLEYDYNVAAFNEFLTTFRCPDERVFRTRPSSNADIYTGPENLFDFNFGTVWAEGAPHQGSGEYLDITLDDYPVCGIVIMNGFTKSEDDFTENCRVAKVKIEREYIDAGNCIRRDERICDIQYESYHKVNASNFSRYVTVLADYGNIHTKVRKIRLTILDVHPGLRFDRTCISELIILGNE